MNGELRARNDTNPCIQTWTIWLDYNSQRWIAAKRYARFVKEDMVESRMREMANNEDTDENCSGDFDRALEHIELFWQTLLKGIEDE